MKYLLFICAIAGMIAVARKHSTRAVSGVSAFGEVAGEEKSTVVSLGTVQEVTQNTNGKVLIYFWQPQCSSCERMESIVDQTEKEFPNIPVIRVNTRLPENREIHDKYGIVGTPTFIVLEKDRILARNNGPFLNKSTFQSFLRPSKISRTTQ